MTKNIYTVLKKINFDKRVDKEIEIIKKCEGKENFNIIVSQFVFKNFCFGLVRDFYDNVLEETIDLEDRVSDLNDRLQLAIEVLMSVINDEEISKNMDAGLLMYIQTNFNKIKGGKNEAKS